MPAHAAPPRPHKLCKYLIALIAAPILLFGVAGAYFALNTGTGSFTVSNAGFTISLQPPTGAPLAPGNGATQEVAYIITNNTNQTLTLNTETASIVTDQAGGIYDTLTTAWVDTCESAWFNLTWGDGGIPLPRQIIPGAAMTAGAMFITMPANSAINQNSCVGLSPEVSLAVT